jgi:hypothetical protein
MREMRHHKRTQWDNGYLQHKNEHTHCRLSIEHRQHPRHSHWDKEKEEEVGDKPMLLLSLHQLWWGQE